MISEKATTFKLITQLEKRIIDLETIIGLLIHNRSMINTELHSEPHKIRQQSEKVASTLINNLTDIKMTNKKTNEKTVVATPNAKIDDNTKVKLTQ